MSKPNTRCRLCKQTDCTAAILNPDFQEPVPANYVQDRVDLLNAIGAEIEAEIAAGEARNDEFLSAKPVVGKVIETTAPWIESSVDRNNNKNFPLATGVLDYFPDALREVAYVSKVGNEQHNPGEPLHWAKEKSQDEPDALMRHLAKRGTFDHDGTRHSAKVAWRALAMLQREIEKERANKDPEDMELAS